MRFLFFEGLDERIGRHGQGAGEETAVEYCFWVVFEGVFEQIEFVDGCGQNIRVFPTFQIVSLDGISELRLQGALEILHFARFCLGRLILFER